MIKTMAVRDPAWRNVVAFPPALSAAMTLEAVSVQRGARDVLCGIDLVIPTGAITAIVGPSGAGKSTLLGVLNGLIAVRAGTVTIDGLGRLNHRQVLAQHRKRIATVFQDHALIDRLSALDNVLLGLADLRNPLSLAPWPEAYRLRAARALAEVGLLDHAGERVGRLSGGERQRVGLARALVRQPRILLADEPFASVDPGLAQRLCDELRQAVVSRGVTLVIVLHQVALARTFADRIVGLRNGRVQFVDRACDFDPAAEASLFRSTMLKGAVEECVRSCPPSCPA